MTWLRELCELGSVYMCASCSHGGTSALGLLERFCALLLSVQCSLLRELVSLVVVA